MDQNICTTPSLRLVPRPLKKTSHAMQEPEPSSRAHSMHSQTKAQKFVVRMQRCSKWGGYMRHGNIYETRDTSFLLLMYLVLRMFIGVERHVFFFRLQTRGGKAHFESMHLLLIYLVLRMFIGAECHVFFSD